MPRGINFSDEERLQGRNVNTANAINVISPGVVEDGIILFLDAGNSVSYPRSGTVWYDLGDRKTNGTLTNGPTFSLDGGGAIVFDGTNDQVDSINLSAVTNFTIEMWVFDARVNNATYRDLLTYNGNSGSYTFNNTTFGTSGNALQGRAFSGITAPAQNTWFRFLYIKNGDLWVNNTKYTGTGTDRTYGALSFGNTRTDVNNRLNGRISNIRIYNRNLAEGEIRQNFDALRARFGV